MLRGDRETCRLLEAGFGEQHPVGERSELYPCSGPKPGLVEYCRDETRTVAGLAEASDQLHDIVCRRIRRQRVQQAEALWR